MNKRYMEELNKLCNQIDLTLLKDKSIMITGASGLIGSYIVDAIMRYNNQFNSNIKVFACIRNIQRAWERFNEYKGNPLFCLIAHDISIPNNFSFIADDDISYKTQRETNRFR